MPITSDNGPYDSVAESLPKCPIESDNSSNKCRISPQVGANYIRQWSLWFCGRIKKVPIIADKDPNDFVAESLSQ